MVVMKSNAIPNGSPKIELSTPIIGVAKVMKKTAMPAVLRFKVSTVDSVPLRVNSTIEVVVSKPYFESTIIAQL